MLEYVSNNWVWLLLVGIWTGLNIVIVFALRAQIKLIRALIARNDCLGTSESEEDQHV